MHTYKHQVQYYETDKMKFTHHSNYICFMEEARVDFLQYIGWSYDKLEEMGIISPVIQVHVDYKKSTTFPDIIDIETHVLHYKGTRLELEYTMRVDNEIVAYGTSQHCFLNEAGRPIILKKQFPEFHQVLEDLCSNK